MPVQEQLKNEHTVRLEPQLWVANYADYLLAFALRRYDDVEAARDLVQETFFAALKGIHQFEGKSAEKTWLTSILKHKICDLYRRQSSGPAHICNQDELQAKDHFFESEDGHWVVAQRPKEIGADTSDPLERKELGKIIAQCMKKLPVLWYAAFSMKFLDDECAENICEELKVSRANYWVILHRTKLNLRACLQKNWNV
jgi:RNA polymerase sigma-70 factor (ECF subfamily)